MPIINLFGEEEYTEEELKEIEAKKKAEAEAKKKAEAERKAQEQILNANKIKFSDYANKLSKLYKFIEEIDDLGSHPVLADALTTLAEDIERVQSLKNGTADEDAIYINIMKTYEEPFKEMGKIEVEQVEKRAAAEKEKKEKGKTYTYPFRMYFGHDYRDITGMFEEGKKYTEKDITKVLIDHGFKEFKFANEIQYEYFENENCLMPKLKVGNRG